MNNQQILGQLANKKQREAFKSMREDMETGKALLNPEQLAQFLKAASLPQVMLNSADFKLMKSHEKNLSRVGIKGRVLQNGYTKQGETNPEITAAEKEFGANVLSAKKLKALCEIEDDELDDNLEQEQYTTTLLNLMGERVGEDIEFFNVFSSTDLDYDTNPLLCTTDGWIKSAGQQLKSTSVASASSGSGSGTGTGTGSGSGTSTGSEENTFDVANGVESIFDKLLLSIPPRFRHNRNGFVFFTPFEVEDAYRNVLRGRQTNLGDTNQTGFNGLLYKGIPIVHCPTLDAEDGRAIDDTASILLTKPSNMAYGVWKNVTIEPYRKPADELTQFWYRLRADCDYYFREGASVAKLSLDEVAELPDASRV